MKVPQFSFLQLAGSDPVLGVEMQSTGEVACFGPTFADALVKALVATGVRLVPKGGRAFLSVGGPMHKAALLPTARELHRLGFRLAATEDTAAFLDRAGATGRAGPPQGERARPAPERRSRRSTPGDIDVMLNVPSSLTQEKLERMLEDEYVLRRRAIELGIPLFTSLEAFAAYIEGIAWLEDHPLTVDALYGSPEPGAGPGRRVARQVPIRGRRPRRRRRPRARRAT